MTGKGSYLSLPALSGFKLTKITLRPVNNHRSSKTATINSDAGAVVVGGDQLPFYGNTTDTWTLLETEENTSYRVVTNSQTFSIGEIRLAYQRVGSVGFSGNIDEIIVDKDAIPF